MRVRVVISVYRRQLVFPRGHRIVDEQENENGVGAAPAHDGARETEIALGDHFSLI